MLRNGQQNTTEMNCKMYFNFFFTSFGRMIFWILITIQIICSFMKFKKKALFLVTMSQIKKFELYEYFSGEIHFPYFLSYKLPLYSMTVKFSFHCTIQNSNTIKVISKFDKTFSFNCDEL